MMTYTAPDGHIMESLPYPQEVVYFCEYFSPNFSDGIYEAYEVEAADTEIGIQAINIIVEVNGLNMTNKIIEFSDEQLIEYQNNNKLI